MSGTWSNMTCFADHITLAYSFHIRIFSSFALVVSDTTAAVKLSHGYVIVAPMFVGTGNGVLPDWVAYMLGVPKIHVSLLTAAFIAVYA